MSYFADVFAFFSIKFTQKKFSITITSIYTNFKYILEAVAW